MKVKDLPIFAHYDIGEIARRTRRAEGYVVALKAGHFPITNKFKKDAAYGFNMTEQEWDDVIAVHLKGTFTVVKHACILFRQQRSGRVITFSSQSGLVGNSGQANYGAAKSGIAGFTKVVAKDMGRYGATANSIAPRAQTRMIGAIPDSAAELRSRSGVASLDEGNELQHLDPDGIAPFVCYLATDFAANVNGQTFLVYGDTVSLMSQPRPMQAIYCSDGHWDMDDLSSQARNYLIKDIYNPAPAA